MSDAKLYLIPSPIGEESVMYLDSMKRVEVLNLRIFFVEELKAARRFLRQLDPVFPLSDCRFIELSEHSALKDIAEHFQSIGTQSAGIISEAGCPCVADPGAELVRMAHAAGRVVIPLVGPSSIMLALMASGMNGQNFVFHGYLPKESKERVNKIKDLQNAAMKNQQTQIFIETPYRNQNLFDELLKACHPKTSLCLAIDLLTPRQFIKTQSIQSWKTTPVSLPKSPAVFLLAALR